MSLQFITSNPNFNDYRPTPDASGTKILFERTPFPNPKPAYPPQLYLASHIGGSGQTVQDFLPMAGGIPPYQSRPDWSWVTGQVAFSAGPGPSEGTLSVYTVGSNGTNLVAVPNTSGYIYPIWSSDGKMLVVFNANPPTAPFSSLIDPNGAVVVANLNGTDARGQIVLAGFAAPQPGNPHHIAFAGQVNGTAPSYDQELNYVFLNKLDSSGLKYSCAPLEPNASITAYDSTHQGRAPYWSPNGRYIVFESKLSGGNYALFLANVAAVQQGARPVWLTDPLYGAQHAKFLKDGTHLVCTAYQTPSGGGPRGIAILDISTYLT